MHVFRDLTRMALTISIVMSLCSVSIFAEPITIRWAAAVNAQAAETHQRQVEVWNANHSDVKIQFELWERSGYSDKIKVAVAAGTAPDIFQVGPTDFSDMAHTGLLLNLQSYMEKSGFNEEFFGPALDAYSYNGEIHGVPREGGPSVLHYNKDAFDDSGLSYPGPGWTWNDYLEDAKRTKRVNADGEVTRWGAYTNNVWPLWVWSNGGDILSENNTEAVLDQPNAVEAIRWLADLIHESEVHPTTRTGGELTQMFTGGSLAMRSGARSHWYIYANSASVDWGMELHPQGKNGLVSNLLGNALVISDTSQHPDEAFEAVRWILGHGGWTVRMSASEAIGVPMNKKAIQDDLYLSNGSPYLSPEINLRIAEALGTGRYLPNIPEWPQVNGIINKHLANVWKGTADPRNALTVTTEEIDGLLSQVR